MRFFVLVLSLSILAAAARPDEKPHSTPTAGLHNVYRLTDKLYSGSGPEGDVSFASLKKLGIKTVISVDGAKPDVERAKKYGLRYVHIPIGYNGVPREKALLLAKAVRELPGPFYIHCHHGKHRGPSAAAVARLCTDDKCGTDQALTILQSAGTDPRYQGLFRSVREFQRPTAEEMAQLPKELPQAVQVAGMTQAMVNIDHAWDNLKLVRTAGWKAPPNHPDIDPPHEALQLLEAYKEMARLPEITKRPEDFRRWLAAGQANAEALEKLLRAAKAMPTLDTAAVEKLYRQGSAVCTQCHAKYRDVPDRP